MNIIITIHKHLTTMTVVKNVARKAQGALADAGKQTVQKSAQVVNTVKAESIIENGKTTATSVVLAELNNPFDVRLTLNDDILFQRVHRDNDNKLVYPDEFEQGRIAFRPTLQLVRKPMTKAALYYNKFLRKNQELMKTEKHLYIIPDMMLEMLAFAKVEVYQYIVLNEDEDIVLRTCVRPVDFGEVPDFILDELKEELDTLKVYVPQAKSEDESTL